MKLGANVVRLSRAAVAGLVVVLGLALFALVVGHVPRGSSGGVSFHEWYGNWQAALVASAVFTVFLLAFARPRRKVEWRSTGLYVAFLLSLFTEMFGLPLTIFLLSSFLDLSPWAFGNQESHLWAYLLDRLGLLPLDVGVYVVMVISVALIAAGTSLVAVGWATVYRGRAGLVTGGIYRFLRHPQYLGLILVILGFNVQWPTLPTLLMAPILVGMYVRLARREDEELARRFGEDFRRYAARTPAFLPRLRPSGPVPPETEALATPLDAEADRRPGEEA